MKNKREHVYYLWRTPLSNEGGSAVISKVPEIVEKQMVNFDTGHLILKEIDTPLVIQRKPGETGPMLDNIRSYGKWAIIASEKLKGILLEAGISNIQWFPLIIEDQLENVKHNYWCGNIVGVVDCIDREKSVFDEFDLFRRMWIDEKLANDQRIFRLNDYEEIHILVHYSLKEYIEEKGCSGISFVPANGFCDLEADPIEEDIDQDEEDYIPWT